MQAAFIEKFPTIFKNNSGDTFKKIIDFSNGKKRPDTSGNIPVYGGNGILAYTANNNADNCIIIGRVGAYCGNTFLCNDSCWVSDNAIQAKSKLGDSQLFIYYLLKNSALPSRHIGTGQPLMTQGILNAIPCTLPANEDIEEFITTYQPMQTMVDSNIKECKQLASLRDNLLPKLMSGELDVSKVKI